MYALVDVLEQCTDFLSFGRDQLHAPIHNSYVPVRHTLMPKPDITSDKELGYSYNRGK